MNERSACAVAQPTGCLWAAEPTERLPTCMATPAARPLTDHSRHHLCVQNRPDAKFKRKKKTRKRLFFFFIFQKQAKQLDRALNNSTAAEKSD